MKQLTTKYQYDKLEFIKNPVIAEFLSLPTDTSFTETELETSIISNLQKFLMELGKDMLLLHGNNISIRKNKIILLIWSSIIII